MNILTCNTGSFDFKLDPICNQVTLPKVSITPTSNGCQLTIENACYCKIRREIGSLELVGGTCEIECTQRWSRATSKTFDILPHSNLAYIRGDIDKHEAAVPFYLKSTLRYTDETGEQMIDFTFDKYNTQRFVFKSPQIKTLIHLMQTLKLEELLPDNMTPLHDDPSCAIRLSKYANSQEVQEILSTLESSISSLDVNAIQELRNSPKLYDIGADNFFNEVLDSIKTWKKSGAKNVKRCNMQCAVCFKGKEVVAFKDEDNQHTYGLYHLFESDKPIEVYGCNYPVPITSEEPIEFTALLSLLEQITQSLQLGNHNLLLNCLAPNCKFEIDRINPDTGVLEEIDNCTIEQAAEYLIDDLTHEEGVTFSIEKIEDLGVDNNPYLANYPTLVISLIDHLAILTITEKYGKVTELGIMHINHSE